MRHCNYEGGIGDIKIPHGRGKQVDEFPSESEQSILRSVLSEAIRIARIARPCALSDASGAAWTFDDVSEFRNNNIDFGGHVTELVSESMADFPISDRKADLSATPRFKDPRNSGQRYATPKEEYKNG